MRSRSGSTGSLAKKTLSVAVFCSGNGSNLEALLLAEKRGALGPARIDLVVCDRPEAYAIVRAKKYGKRVFLAELEKFTAREEFEGAIWSVLKKDGVGLICLAGFMRILSAGFVKDFRDRILNIHPSLLPAFKGAHAVRDAWEHGVKVTGVTVHFVTPDLDDGPVILQEAVAVDKKDTEKSLEEKIHQVEHRLYPQAVRLFAEGRLKIHGRKIIVVQ